MARYTQERNYENLNKGMFEGTKDFGIPYIAPVQCDVEDWISFNFARSCDEREAHGLHFYIDDYQFVRLWNMPDYYLPMISSFKAVMSPDFSTYTDFPLAIQIYNHYRKHWLAAYWQFHGLTVVPTISWSDRQSFDWCFDGEPVGGCVSVSSVGTQTSVIKKALFLDGYREMLARLKPSKIIFYGDVPDECEGNIYHVEAFHKKRRAAMAGG